MSRDLKEKGWEKVQIKAFTSWLNNILAQRNLSLQDIKTDLSDGVKLINFLELLGNKKVQQKYDMKPPSRIQCIQNLHIALQFLEKTMDVKTTTSAEDFADQNLKMILGFLWSLFKKFRISVIKHEDKSSEEGLLLWCKKTTEGYADVNIESYKTSFRDGLAFLALCDKFIENKEILDFSKFSKDNGTDNLNHVFEIAEKSLGIPKLLEAQEVNEGNVDERSLVLYISLYFHAFVAKQQKLEMQREIEEAEGRLKGLTGSLEERARLASQLQDENSKLKEELEAIQRQLQEERTARSELQEKESYLNEKVGVLKQLLEQEQEEKEALEKELKAKESDAETFKKQASELSEVKINLEQQVGKLQSEVTDFSSKYKVESEGRKKENEENSKRSNAELKGLGVLKQNLEAHVEDLNRWMKYLDLDTQAEVDFSGEVRPQIMLDITKENFDDQLAYLSKKLDKENHEIIEFLKQKEMETNAKKANADKKKKKEKKEEK